MTSASSNELRVFVSYSERDREWAVWTDWHLRQLGYSTEMAAYDHTAGDDIDQRITQAIRRCDVMIALLSPAYEASKWCEREWERADQVAKLRQALICPYQPSERFARRSFQKLHDKTSRADAVATLRVLVEGASRPSRAPLLPSGPPLPGSAATPKAPNTERPLHKRGVSALVLGVIGSIGVVVSYYVSEPQPLVHVRTSLSPAMKVDAVPAKTVAIVAEPAALPAANGVRPQPTMLRGTQQAQPKQAAATRVPARPPTAAAATAPTTTAVADAPTPTLNTPHELTPAAAPPMRETW